MLDDEGEVEDLLEAELVLETVDDVLHGGGGVVLEALGLAVLEEHLQHVRHQRLHAVVRRELTVRGRLEERC